MLCKEFGTEGGGDRKQALGPLSPFEPKLNPDRRPRRHGGRHGSP